MPEIVLEKIESEPAMEEAVPETTAAPEPEPVVEESTDPKPILGTASGTPPMLAFGMWYLEGRCRGVVRLELLPKAAYLGRPL